LRGRRARFQLHLSKEIALHKHKYISRDFISLGLVAMIAVTILLALRRAMLFAVLLAPAIAVADGGYRYSSYASAQQDADDMARTGQLRHMGRAGGRREGIGFSTAGPQDAMRRCCFFGQYPIAESGVAYSPSRRGWFACIRYGR